MEGGWIYFMEICIVQSPRNTFLINSSHIGHVRRIFTCFIGIKLN